MRLFRLRATPESPEDDGEERSVDEEMLRAASVEKLRASFEGPPPMDGEELRNLVFDRWGLLYDTRICKRRDGLGKMRIYLQVMWKHLGQRSFPLSEAQYNDQLQAVAELVTEWGCAEQVREEIPKTPKSPVLDTTGASAVMFPLNVQLDPSMGGRSDEWWV